MITKNLLWCSTRYNWLVQIALAMNICCNWCLKKWIVNICSRTKFEAGIVNVLVFLYAYFLLERFVFSSHFYVFDFLPFV